MAKKAKASSLSSKPKKTDFAANKRLYLQQFDEKSRSLRENDAEYFDHLRQLIEQRPASYFTDASVSRVAKQFVLKVEAKQSLRARTLGYDPA